MTTRRVTASAAIALAVAGVLFLLGRAGLASWGSTPAAMAGPAPASPAPRPADSTRPLTHQPPAPASASAPAGHKPAPTASPAPFIQTFAAQPGVRPQPPLKSPTATLPVKAYVDGCDHAYGTKTQCVPLTFPPGVTDKCAWLAAQGFANLRVVGADDQHLDPDKNGIACD